MLISALMVLECKYRHIQKIYLFFFFNMLWKIYLLTISSLSDICILECIKHIRSLLLMVIIIIIIMMIIWDFCRTEKHIYRVKSSVKRGCENLWLNFISKLNFFSPLVLFHSTLLRMHQQQWYTKKQ
jgi:hypothetical protein